MGDRIPRVLRASSIAAPDAAHTAEQRFADLTVRRVIIQRSRVSPDALPGAARTRLERLALRTDFDLVLHLPLRYEDETRLTLLRDARAGETVQLDLEVVASEVRYRPRRMLVCSARSGDEELTLRFFNFYPGQAKHFTRGARLRVLGEVRKGMFGAEMVHPHYRVLHGEVALADSLTPIYPTTAGLAQPLLRRLIDAALERVDLDDTLPPELLERYRLPGFRDSIRYLHHPPPDAAQSTLEARNHPAWRRVKFDELLAQQLSMRLHYRRRMAVRAPAVQGPGNLSARLLASLPFRLTRAQRRALAEIRADLMRAHPMQRLLQGDVGSGKTVVSALAALQAIESGWQVAVMAPTEILAEQHHAKFSSWLAPLGVRVAWLSGSLSRSLRRAAVRAVSSAEAQIAVGTHALFQNEVDFARLGFAIVDEQHRFGVHQRLQLRLKGTPQSDQLQPHQLMMSATPIPRTLAMSYYADLDVSVIDEPPPGRKAVVTKLVSEARREEVIARIRDACMAGRQAYWVCPLIEESAEPEGAQGKRRGQRGIEALQLKTVLETFETVRQTFPDLRVALVHGRLPSAEKAAVMAAFQSGEVQLLVATTVVEVGVDVPNASLMVIEHAERMGLSQLHQLRGRVGRGAEASACILLYQNPLSDLARERLRIIYEMRDGFEIAREDLRLRGPGELLGARQSGVPMLRFADLTTDLELLEAARDAAERMLREAPARAQAHLERWLGARSDYLEV
jgi:ATP-dependent DNA helicase RecG